MLKFMFAAVVLFFVSFTYAERNPQMRICRLLGGKFWVAQGYQDHYAMCIFKDAAIDTVTLVRKENGDSTLALQYYLSGNDQFCSNGLLQTLVGDDADMTVCYYEDNSMIEFDTLQRGFGNEQNERLDSALSR